MRDVAGVRLTIPRATAEQGSGVTCAIRLSRRARTYRRFRVELGVRKLFAETELAVVTDPDDLLLYDEVLLCFLRPDATLTVPKINFGAARAVLPDADVDRDRQPYS